MNVVYDIALLGQGHVNPALRTGIHRYAFELFRALRDHPEVTLMPATSRDYDLAKIFMSQTPFCHGMDFPKPPFNHWRHSLLPLLGDDIPKLTTSSSKVSKWEVVKLNWAIHVIREIIPKIAPPVAYSSLRDCRIYHSPVAQIPEEIVPKKTLRRVLTVHDLIPIRFPYFFSGGEERSLRRAIHSLQPSDHVICVSEATRVDLLNFTKKIKPDHVHVAHLGVSDRFQPCEDPAALRETLLHYQIDPARPYILSLCTLEPRKNIPGLLKAISDLKDAGELAEYQIVLAGGKGWMLESLLDALGNHRNLAESVVITGRIDDDDLAAIYSGATVFAFPSLYEGFGLPPLEAMKAGVPVVTSKVASMPEVVGDAGLLVDPHSTSEIGQAILRLCQDRALRDDLRAKGLERARTFTWEKCVNTTVDIYKKISIS